MFEYRLRWDSVLYEPGTLHAVAYKNGKKWAEQILETTGQPSRLIAEVDRNPIRPNGSDLAFITIRIADDMGRTVPDARNKIRVQVDNPGVLVATDNGDPTDMTSFVANERNAFNGLCLAIVRFLDSSNQPFHVHITGEGLKETHITIYPLVEVRDK